MAGTQDRPASPISLAVITSILAVLLVIFFTGAIALNYALMVHYIHTLQAQQAKQAVGTCQRLKDIARSKDGAVLYQPDNPNSFDVRLANGMTQLYLKSGCVKITGPL